MTAVQGKNEKAQMSSGPQAVRTQRPNYFVAVQVSHVPEACTAIKRVQSTLLENEPDLKQAIVDVESAHITLGVFHSGSESTIESAKEALRAAVQENALRQTVISLAGISTFRNEVLYIDVADGEGKENLSHMAFSVREQLEKRGVVESAAKMLAFVPHVTIAKTSKMKWTRKRGRTKIPTSAYEACVGVDDEGGVVVPMVEIQLCAMSNRAEGHYYSVEETVPLISD
eukprot:CAMPEP_0118936200 /NCGR_PEP_ID=MMETSP1169-20130426/17213_1 /TAXON_ID=36882 /ORGANISM="Pyramimonas obovata, Strain CCMP722" /LENGTH=227 /DNA_ID=CAMNT_0006879357 /DNA_START=192 /DNA_END=875 /DNA_ORIENTATION=+